MLAKTYLDANQLGIKDKERDALIMTLDVLEDGTMKHVSLAAGYVSHFNDVEHDLRVISVDIEPGDFTGGFNMDFWCAQLKCGTVHCIGGTAEFLGKVRFDSYDKSGNEALKRLFYPDSEYNDFQPINLRDITVKEAAQALRNYLTLGEANWPNVLGLE